MIELGFKTRTAASNTAVSVVEVTGPLDMDTAGEFGEALKGLFRQNRLKIVLDLDKLTYLSSTGIGVLVGHTKEVREKKGDIKIAGENQEFLKVVELLDMERIFPLYKSEEDAANDF